MTDSQAFTTEGSAPSATAAALLLELASAYSDLRECVAELEQVLSQPLFDPMRLTTIRLKVAQMRLARGPLVAKIAAHLEGKVSPSQASQLKQFRDSHDQMLRGAAAHTNKWPLDAIEENWAEYRSETAMIARMWMDKVKDEQHFIYPLLRNS